jgi:glycosyltransferase involved in cell wall biosynthesis
MESSKGLERIVLSLAEALTAKSATIVIPISASLRARYEELGFARQRPIHVLGKGSAAGVDLVKFRHTKPPAIRLDHRAKTLQGLGLDPAITTIGFVGRITEDKGLATLLGAFRLLKSNSIAAQILFVGPVESRQLRDQIEATEGACYVGPTVDPRPLYESIEILCLPSLREGLPSVVLEAAAYGTPTIGSNATGVRDAVEHGKTGLIVPAKDEGALAEAVTTLIMNSKLRHALGRNARAYVTEFFSEDVVVGLYFQFFERLVRNDSHSGGSLTVSFD